MSIFLGDPQISIGLYVWKSMIPALIGNLVGGCVLVGTVYWYLNLTGEPRVLIDGVAYSGDTQHLTGQSDDAPSPARSASPDGEKRDSAEDMV